MSRALVTRGWLASTLVLAIGCAANPDNGSDAADAADAAGASVDADGSTSGLDADLTDTVNSPDVAAPDAASDVASPDSTATACKSDKDCAMTGTVCDKGTGVCVQCNGDADCEGDARCKQHVCAAVVTCTSSKDCAATLQVCDKNGGICVDCLSAADCATGKICAASVCVAPICSPGAKSCTDATTAQVCSADGTSWQTTPCPADHDCVEGACISQQACTPDATSCDGPLTLLTCKADGSGTSATACPAAHVCATKGGISACEAVTCTPGSYVCVGEKIAECSAGGEPGDISDDCAAKGQSCKDGACVTGPPPGCTPGAASCKDAVTVETCNPDGSSTTTKTCGAQQACFGGQCVATLCTPNAKDCNDGKTEKTCAADGTSWTAVQSCATNNPCAEVGCIAKQGCVEAPLQDGAACGDGKLCQAGVCVAPSGCQLCAVNEACINGACQACAQVSKPEYVGALWTMPPPTTTLPGLELLTFSPKHQEWWWFQTGQQGSGGLCTRYDVARKPTGQTFALPPYVRAVDTTADGHYLVAFDPPSGSAQLARIDGPAGNVVWKIEATWTQVIPGIARVGNVLYAFNTATSEKVNIEKIDIETGKKLGGGYFGIQLPQNVFAVGDSFYHATGGTILGLTRILHDPAIATVGYAPIVSVANASLGNALAAFDGRYACISASKRAGYFACVDYYPSCPKPAGATTTFAGSALMTTNEQQALVTQLGLQGQTWVRCKLPGWDASPGSFTAPDCAAGPTLLLHAAAHSDPNKLDVGGVFSSVGWTSATNGSQDDKLSVFRLDSTVKGVPTSGLAKILRTSSNQVGVDGLLGCSSTSCTQTTNIPKFACSDGKTGNVCAAVLWPAGLTAATALREAWTKP